MQTTNLPPVIWYKGCLVERNRINGMYSARHDYAGTLRADTLGGIKAMIRGADADEAREVFVNQPAY